MQMVFIFVEQRSMQICECILVYFAHVSFET